jgi:hypothetical protein
MGCDRVHDFHRHGAEYVAAADMSCLLPIGVILDPGFKLVKYRELPFHSSLCGEHHQAIGGAMLTAGLPRAMAQARTTTALPHLPPALAGRSPTCYSAGTKPPSSKRPWHC